MQRHWQSHSGWHIHTHFIPKNVTKISQFFTKNFPVLAPTSGNRKCIRNGKYFLRFLYQNFPRFRYTFYPHFRNPFYPRFRYPFYPRFRYPFYPHTLFIHVSVPTLSRAISNPTPDAAMHSYTVPCPQFQNRTQQRTIRMYCSPLVSGHKTSSQWWSTFYPLMHASSILVVIANKGAAMCTRQRQKRMSACAHTITIYNLLSPWHRHTEVLNGLSAYSTVLQRQVKAEEEHVLTGASTPEHRTIALEAKFIGE